MFGPHDPDAAAERLRAIQSGEIHETVPDPLPGTVIMPLPTPKQPFRRLTVVERVYFQSESQQPTGIDPAYGVDLQTDEEPYRRRITVTQVWEPLDHGWLEEASVLVLRNDESRFQGRPTPEQSEALSRKVVELAIMVPIWDDPHRTAHSLPKPAPIAPITFALLSPQESLRLRPSDLGRLAVRCQEGQAVATVFLFPR